MRAVAPALHVRSASRARAGLVLLHGVMSHAGWFASLREELAARGVSSIAVDRRGSGAATLSPGICDADAWAADVAAAVTQLRTELDRVALFGWCWGARGALVAATQLPIEHLILAAPGIAMAEAVRARALELAAAPGDPVALPFPIEAFSDDPSVLSWIRNDERAWRSQPRAFLPVSRALLEEALAAIPALRVPVTTFLAAQDRIVDNDRIAALLPGHPVQVLPGGHALVLESPALVAERTVAAILP